MRLHVPSLALSATEAVVTAVVEPDDPGREPMNVWWAVDRSNAGRIDLTSNPFVPVASVISLLVGERLTVAGPASARLIEGAETAIRRLAGWLDLPPVAIAASATGDPGPAAAGAGLFFTRGVDSWWSLLHHRGEITHLIGLDGMEPGQSSATLAEVWAGHEHAAAMVGLPLVRVTGNVRSVLDPLCAWDWTHGAALASAALLLSPVLGRVLVAGTYPHSLEQPWGSHPDIDPMWSTEATAIVHDGAEISRWDKTAELTAEPSVVATLRVCWQPADVPNCGRCEKCLRTMTALAAMGVLDRAQFAGPLDAEAIRALAPVSGAQRAFVEEVVAHLEPGDPLRSAWSSLLAEGGYPVRVLPASTPMTGPSVPERVAPTLARLGWILDTAPATPEDSEPVTVLDLGWEPGQVPLRPSAVDAATVVHRMTGADDRPHPWVVAEPHDPEGIGATEQAYLVALLTNAWGRGLTYLSGLGWAPSQPAGLGPEVVAHLLAAARVRAWWRNDGPLDPLRLVESLERGCLPLQVMPAGPAVAARRRLPPELAAVVVDEPQVRTFDLSDSVRLRDAAAAIVLAGSVERDVSLLLGVAPTGSDR